MCVWSESAWLPLLPRELTRLASANREGLRVHCRVLSQGDGIADAIDRHVSHSPICKPLGIDEIQKVAHEGVHIKQRRVADVDGEGSEGGSRKVEGFDALVPVVAGPPDNARTILIEDVLCGRRRGGEECLGDDEGRQRFRQHTRALLER